MTLVVASEFEHDPKSERGRDVVNLHVECAAQLFIHAACRLNKPCKDEYSKPLRPIGRRKPKVRALLLNGNEDEGFTEEQWRFRKTYEVLYRFGVGSRVCPRKLA